MDKYDYSQLDENEFEHLSVLIGANFFNSSKYQVFGRGADGGIDGTIQGCFEGSRVRIAVQAKHRGRYPTSDIIADIAKLDTKEFDGLLVVTSANPQPNTVAKTEAAFRQHFPNGHWFHWTRSQLDIEIEKEPASALLFPQIARRGSKLDLLLQNPMVARGLDELDHLESDNSLAVTNLVADIASTVLTRGVCIVSGPPGIGKTTAALMASRELIDRYQENGKTPPVLAVVSLQDALSSPIRTHLPVIFYYDDFLGPVSLHDSAKNGNISQVLRLIERCRTGRNFLILTTRSYLIRNYQSIRGYSDLTEAFGLDHEDSIEITCTSKYLRAQILSAQIRGYLAEHQDQVDTPEYLEFVQSFLNERGYNQVLKAPIFNPRALSTSLRRERQLDQNTSSRILQGLANPQQQYTDGFTTLTEQEKDFLREILIKEESAAPNSIYQTRDLWAIGNFIQTLEGIWISRIERSSVGSAEIETLIRIANPSVKEFLANQFFRDLEQARLIFEHSMELGFADAAFAIVNRYLTDEAATASVTNLLIELASRSEAVNTHLSISQILKMVSSANAEHLSFLIEKWLAQEDFESLSVSAEFFLDLAELTEPSRGLIKRSELVQKFLETVDVSCDTIDDIRWINLWLKKEPSFQNSLGWIEREIELQWEQLEEDVMNNPDNYDSDSISDLAGELQEASDAFDLRLWLDLDFLLESHNEEYLKLQDQQEYQNDNALYHSIRSNNESIHQIMKLAFSL